MASTLRRVLMLIILGLVALVPLSAQSSRKRSAAPTTPTKKDFAVSQLEYYMSDDGIAYIRPGLKLKVNSVTIGADRKPVIDFNLTDNFDQPVDRLGKTTPGAIAVSFIASWYNPATRQYTAYTTRTQTTPAASSPIWRLDTGSTPSLQRRRRISIRRRPPRSASMRRGI